MKLVHSLAALALATPVTAQETTTFVDGQGAEVSVPSQPERIVSLHDTSLTVALLELGVMPVGSHGRTTADGTPYIRSSLTATGVDFDNSDINFMGNLPADIERVAAENPDLILTTSWQTADVGMLREIAPTYVFDIATTDDFDVYDRLAEITGTADRAEALKARYGAQIALLRDQLDADEIQVSVIQGHDGQLHVWNTYGTLGKVLRDAGFQFPEAINDIEGNEREIFSAEQFPRFDADFIFVTYRADRGETATDARAALDAVFPSWCAALHACRENQVVYLPRSLASTATYDAAGEIAYAILANMGGREFSVRDE